MSSNFILHFPTSLLRRWNSSIARPVMAHRCSSGIAIAFNSVATTQFCCSRSCRNSICSCLSVRLLSLANCPSLELVCLDSFFACSTSTDQVHRVSPCPRVTWAVRLLFPSGRHSCERRFLHVAAPAAVEPDIRCAVPTVTRGQGDRGCVA